MQLPFHLSSLQKHTFWGTFAAVFILVLLQHLGFQPMSLIRPVPDKVDIFRTEILPKLETKRNTFTLKKNTSLITKAYATGEFENATSYAVIDLSTGQVIMEKSLSRPVPIASLTKIMTALVALDLASPKEHFIVSHTASREIPTKIGVVPGEQLTLTELLHAMLLTSANDATEVVREGVDTKYGEDVFIRAMNAKAETLGLKHSHFENPQGFDAHDHYSSAEDLAVLTAYGLMHYPLFAEIVAKDYAFLPADSYHKQFDLYNWNGLLGVYPNVSGVKIGSTDDAGKTTVVVSEREGKKLMAVLLGAPGILERDLWTADLLDAGFAEAAGLAPVKVTETQLHEKYATWQYFN